MDADELLKAHGPGALRLDVEIVDLPEGCAILLDAIERIEAMGDDVAPLVRHAPIVEMLRDPARFTTVAVAWNVRNAAVEGLLMRLGDAVSKASANRIRTTIKTEAKRISDRIRETLPGGEQSRDVVINHGDEPELADLLTEDIGGRDNLATAVERIYRFGPEDGTWDEVDQAWLRARLYSGYERAWIRKRTVKKDGGVEESFRPLKLGDRMAKSVVSVLSDKVARRGFLELPQPLGVPFANGLVTPDGVLRPFQRDDYIREGQRLEIEYDPTAMCPEWLSALRRIWPCEVSEFELRVQVLQEFFAAALFGIATRYQKVMVLIGDGANGKSVVADILRALFPDSVCTAVPIHRMSDPYYAEMLLNSRVNIVGELPSSEVYEASGFKGVADGSPVTARRIREAPITFIPRAAHLFAANALPPVSDHSHGFWRRWIALDFPRRFSPTDADYDPEIISRIRAELPGVARWAVDGAAPLIARKGYVDLQVSMDILDGWKRESNSVAMFAHERMEHDEDGRLPASALYRAYADWCGANGFKAMNLTNFGRKLSKGDGFRKMKTGGQIVYLARMPLQAVHDSRQQAW